MLVAMLVAVLQHVCLLEGRSFQFCVPIRRNDLCIYAYMSYVGEEALSHPGA